MERDRPVDDAVPVPGGQRELSVDDWNRLLILSHTDKKRAFEAYADYYLTTSDQRYWSDTSQLGLSNRFKVVIDGTYDLGPGPRTSPEVQEQRYAPGDEIFHVGDPGDGRSAPE